ncbi:MAG: hypothetical protein QGG73_04400, partial [Candidatus Hydrogenedentes bacterium]|nr:hypothetical protein [Candidatus Hydrogenedentota bacterium]
QGHLSNQIADTRSQLGTLVRLLASRSENGDALTEALDDVQKLQTELRVREEAPPLPDSSRLHEEISGLRTSIEGFHERDRDTEELNRGLEARLVELRTREEVNEKALAEARIELGDLRAALNQRDETVRTATDNTSSLSHTLGLLQKEFESLRSDAELATENEGRVKDELNALRTAIEERLSQPVEPSAETASLTAQIADAAQKERSLHSDLETLRGELRQREDELARVEEEWDQAAAESLRAQDELGETAESLAKVEQELEELRRSIVENEDAETGLSGELEKLKAVQDDMGAELEKAREENAALEERLREARQNQTAAEEQLSEFSGDREAASETLAQAEEYLESARTDASESLKKQESLSGGLPELSGQIEEKSAELERRHTDIDALRSQVDEKEGENLRLLEELGPSRNAADQARSSNALSSLITDVSSSVVAEERQSELLTHGAYLIEREALLDNTIEELRAQIENDQKEPGATEQLQSLSTRAEYLKATTLDIGEDELGRLLLDDVDRPEQAERHVEDLAAPDNTVVEEEKVSELDKGLSERKTELNGRNSELDELRAKVESIEAGLDGRKAESETARDGLAAAELRAEELEAVQHAEAAANREASAATKEKRAALEESVQALTESFEARDDELARLEQQLEGTPEKADSAEPQFSIATAESVWISEEPEEDDPIANAAYDESGRKRSMGEILVEAGILTQDQLDGALAEQRASSRRRLGSIIVENGWADEEAVSQVLAGQLRVSFVRLPEEVIELYAADLMDGEFATHHMCMPIRVDGNTIVVAMANPLDLVAIEDIERRTQLAARPVVATLAGITAAIVKYYGASFDNDDGPPGA